MAKMIKNIYVLFHSTLMSTTIKSLATSKRVVDELRAMNMETNVWTTFYC